MKEIKFRTLDASEIDARVGQVANAGKSVVLLLYKDARVDMTLLDEVVGPMNWKREHTRDNANCIVSIWDEEKKQWVSKEDTGTESNTEAEKGLASDSFKRACFNWGIGRELYTAPFIWIDLAAGEDAKKTKFRVSEIGYDDKRQINYLVIVDKKGDVRFSFGAKAPKVKAQAEPTPQDLLKACKSKEELRRFLTTNHWTSKPELVAYATELSNNLPEK